MKKNKKIFVVLILFILMCSITNNIFADEDIWTQAKKFMDTGARYVGTTQEGGMGLKKMGIDTKKSFKKLVDTLWSIGLLVIFISTVALGIRYMLVLPEEKSRIKAATTPYIIGVVIIFGALTIWKFIIVVLDGSL